MSPHPLISVIVNCHNGEEFVSEALQSIFAQSYKNWEIVFWDNASTDLSASIAKSFNTNRLRYFFNAKKTSLGEARVNACNEAKGKYLAFLDVDDIWLPNKLEKQLNVFKDSANNLGFVYGRSKILNTYNNSLTIFKDGKELPQGNIFAELLKEDFIPFCSSMVDRDKYFEVGGFPIHFHHSTDYWLFLHLAKKYNVGVVQSPCCVFRIHQSNLSHSQQLICARENIELVSKFTNLPEGKIGLKFQYVNLALSYLMEKNYLMSFVTILTKGGSLLYLYRIIKRIFKK